MATKASKRIVLATFGSLGDLHPVLVLGMGLKARGHDVTIATQLEYGEKVAAHGLGFAGVRPDISASDPELARLVMDPKTGPMVVYKDILMPEIRVSYEDFVVALDGADLYLNAPLTLAGLIAADKLGVPRVGTALAPMSFMSAYDPPQSPMLPYPEWFRNLGPSVHGPIHTLFDWVTRSWCKPYYTLRAELGLPKGKSPIFKEQFSSLLNLGMFSPHYAPPQPDWPPNTVTTGFLFYDGPPGQDSHPNEAALEAFLKAGEAPVVFTLGSAAVHSPRRFFEDSLSVVNELDLRAVFLAGSHAATLKDRIGESSQIVVFDYLPHQKAFAQAAAIVHQGGVGTTAQALRSGKPMLTVPFAFDQRDNADRCRRLGLGEILPIQYYNPKRLKPLLNQLLSQSRYARIGKAMAGHLHAENGVNTACDAIEALWQTT